MAEQRMLKFVKVARDMPDKRVADERARGLRRDLPGVRRREGRGAGVRAARQCGVPYCQSHCPLHNNIPDWLRLTAEGRLQRGLRAQPGDQHLPRDLRPHLPAGPALRRQLRHRAVGPRHGDDRRGREVHHRHRLGARAGSSRSAPAPSAAESVGIIGAGPGRARRRGRAARAGVQVTVYDRYDRAGGLLTYGIPGFKLEKDVVMRRIDAAGRRRASASAQLRRRARTSASTRSAPRHDAVLIATGVYKARDLGGAGRGRCRASCGRSTI